MRSSYFIPILLCITFFFDTGHAQDVPQAHEVRAELQALVAQAQSDARMGNAPAAVDALHAAVKGIPQEKAFNTYRSYLYYQLGYVCRQYGAQIGPDHLDKALSYYQRALEMQPGDPNILTNIMLVQFEIGDETAALNTLEKAVSDAPGEEGLLYAAAGDLYQSKGDAAKAWEYYMRALKSNTVNGDAGQKLITLYDALPPEYAPKAVALCRAFDEEGNHRLACKGYEKLLASEQLDYASGELAQMTNRWVAISSELNLVQPGIISKGALADCTYPPILELQYYLEHWAKGEFPSTGPAGDPGWWQKDSHRSFYLLAFQKSLGDYHMRIGEVDAAVGIYEDVLQNLWSSEDFSAEIYGRNDALMTDVLVTLARAYNTPEYADSGKWEHLEGRLFNMKGGSYEMRDSANILKFHLILGQIYFERGEYTGFGATNALFQLSHAVQISEARTARHPETYLPNPTLYENLATVCTKTNNEEGAYRALLSASVAYLEADHLRKAGEMLDQLESLTVSPTSDEGARSDLVRSIYLTRNDITRVEKDQLEKNSAQYVLNQRQFAWLTDHANDQLLAPGILDRQRFKALSDLSARAKEVGAPEVSSEYSSKAKDEMKDIRVMSSQQDVIRMRQLDVTQANFNYSSNKVYRNEANIKPGKTQTFIIPNQQENVKQEVQIDKRVLKKNQVQRQE